MAETEETTVTQVTQVFVFVFVFVFLFVFFFVVDFVCPYLCQSLSLSCLKRKLFQLETSFSQVKGELDVLKLGNTFRRACQLNLFSLVTCEMRIILVLEEAQKIQCCVLFC